MPLTKQTKPIMDQEDHVKRHLDRIGRFKHFSCVDRFDTILEILCHRRFWYKIFSAESVTRFP